MSTPFPYQIVNIRTFEKTSRVIFATIVDDKGRRYVDDTLDYCMRWIEEKHNELYPNDTSHPGFGSEADPERDYEGENRFGPD